MYILRHSLHIMKIIFCFVNLHVSTQNTACSDWHPNSTSNMLLLVLQVLHVVLYLQVLLWLHIHLCPPWVLFYLDHLGLPGKIRVTFDSSMQHMPTFCEVNRKPYSGSSWSRIVESRSSFVTLLEDWKVHQSQNVRAFYMIKVMNKKSFTHIWSRGPRVSPCSRISRISHSALQPQNKLSITVLSSTVHFTHIFCQESTQNTSSENRQIVLMIKML